MSHETEHPDHTGEVTDYSVEECRTIIEESSLSIEDKYTMLQYCQEAVQNHQPLMDGLLLILALIGAYTVIYIIFNMSEGDE